MATTMTTLQHDERAGATIIHGHEECYRQSRELLKGMGFPSGVLPLRNLDECGMVKETGFIWMKQKEPYEHFFKEGNSLVIYGKEVTAYVEKSRMKKMTGITAKKFLLLVPIAEMSFDDPSGKKISFKSPMGFVKSLPVTVFMEEDEKKIYEEKVKEGLLVGTN